MAAVDHRGRVADRHITAALAWDAATRLSIREHDGLLVVTADPHGVFKLTKEGYLRLPADALRVPKITSAQVKRHAGTHEGLHRDGPAEYR
ncbi:hypothetical protein OG205_09430 [Lentzea sp. NBC_00516]|uniref:Uncharacterized protein n=1 Tax=Lentzea sokolovensis TaxID=3095429 RepID=A0ABU4UPX8_9PSEU|nr:MULTISPECIES: hypothetical protein [unclassified Lentzea]MDX8141539.1 hypothetical protein [Lentzea sp. BCCO 10_0061]WUD27195.1 hypothetical protein OG205_09430 [Lentzea sp. NBC_00516]